MLALCVQGCTTPGIERVARNALAVRLVVDVGGGSCHSFGVGGAVPQRVGKEGRERERRRRRGRKRRRRRGCENEAKTKAEKGRSVAVPSFAGSQPTGFVVVEARGAHGTGAVVDPAYRPHFPSTAITAV